MSIVLERARHAGSSLKMTLMVSQATEGSFFHAEEVQPYLWVVSCAGATCRDGTVVQRDYFNAFRGIPWVIFHTDSCICAV